MTVMNPMTVTHTFTNTDTSAPTLLAALRLQLALSWSAARKLLQGRRVAIGGVLCLDEARRLGAGEVVTIAGSPIPPPPTDADVVIRYVDKDLVIVEKPSGMITLRRKSDLSWSWARKGQHPTLDECVARLIGAHAAHRHQATTQHRRLPRLFPVHRIDRDTSGLLVFARHEEAQTRLIQQFSQHSAVRQYLALIPGVIADQTVTSQLIRDRGDGLRGSTSDKLIGEQATTHFRTLRTIGDYSELECRLETGRTNQIRIHLAELGHPVCGDIKYRGALGEPPRLDTSGSPRLALHAAQLRLEHPVSGQVLHYTADWPDVMLRFLSQLDTLR